MKNRTLIFIAALLITTSMSAQDPNLHIYLCFGQSNMEGQGAIEEMDLEVDERFMAFQSLDCPDRDRKAGQWYTAVPPLCQCHSGLSPADYFGRTLVENLPSEVRVGVISVAIGGCDIRLFDKDIYMDYTSTHKEDWFTKKVESYGGNPYEHLMNLAHEAMKDGVIKGILLHQGESNTGDAEWPQYVKTIYMNMLEELDLDPSEVPLIAGEMVGEDMDGCCFAMNPIVNTLPEVIPTAHVVSSEGCPVKDRAHFNAEGYRILGQRYADLMLELLK